MQVFNAITWTLVAMIPLVYLVFYHTSLRNRSILLVVFAGCSLIANAYGAAFGGYYYGSVLILLALIAMSAIIKIFFAKKDNPTD